MLAIETKDLTRVFNKKRKKKFIALDSVSLEVESGQIFGLLGPNGAGKTTLIKILVTLLYPTSGWAKVNGIDVVADPRKLRPLINMVSGGETSGYGILTARENIWMFASFYGIPGKIAKRRADEYLELFGLGADADTKINKLSTGMRQKMNLIRGLVTDPKILFLDEPTLGLDAHIARDVRLFLADWIKQKPDRTILLTTHYMAEAEQLCRNLAIIDRGRIVTSDTTASLIKSLDSMGHYRISLADGKVDENDLRQVPGLSDPEIIVNSDSLDTHHEFKFRLSAEEMISGVFDLCQTRQARILNFSKHRPGLEDLFIRIVGRKLDDSE